MNNMKFTRSEVIKERHSAFQGHAVSVNNTSEVKLAYRRIKQLYLESDHIMLAYNAKGYTDHQDDGEFGAGKKLDQIIAQSLMKNVALFVTRDYGGIHLGQRRFFHIEKVARDILKEHYGF